MLSQWLWFMVCYAEPVIVNHGVLCWASGCASWCAMLCQWLWMMLWYAEPVGGNHGANTELVVVNHGEVCWASGLWIIVCYAEPGVWESWCVMLSQWLWIIVLCSTRCVGIMVNYANPVIVNHYVLFCACRFEPLRVILRQWLFIMLCYSVPVCVTHSELCQTSGCESWCVIMCQ